jgi:hypothetical protein
MGSRLEEAGITIFSLITLCLSINEPYFFLLVQFGLPPNQVETVKLDKYNGRIPSVLVQMKTYLFKHDGHLQVLRSSCLYIWLVLGAYLFCHVITGGYFPLGS